MGRASSRPRSRRASGRACFASTDAFVDVAGITAERAAEGSGSEWSSEEKEEEKETEVVPPGPRPEGVVGVDEQGPGIARRAIHSRRRDSTVRKREGRPHAQPAPAVFVVALQVTINSKSS